MNYKEKFNEVRELIISIRKSANYCSGNVRTNIEKIVFELSAKINSLENYIAILEESQGQKKDATQLHEFTKSELENFYNGKNGRPYYIAVRGVVYNIIYGALKSFGVFSEYKKGENIDTYFNNHPDEFKIFKNKAFRVGILK